MGLVVGLVVGYVLGTRAGDKGFEELRDAWETISTSEEVKDMVTGGLSMASDLLTHGRGILADRLSVVHEGDGLRAA
jgi:hypothetical protein